MKKRKQFNLHNVLDPFTLLEVSQALREIQVGEFLEFTYPGEQIPEKLFKIIPDDQFEIVREETGPDSTGCILIIKRSNVAPVDSDYSSGGCDCS
jgi:TusA-related sulfurtransferase